MRFRNAFTRLLPGDSATTNQVRQVVGAAYSRVLPSPCTNPRLIAYSNPVAVAVGLPQVRATADARACADCTLIVAVAVPTVQQCGTI